MSRNGHGVICNLGTIGSRLIATSIALAPGTRLHTQQTALGIATSHRRQIEYLNDHLLPNLRKPKKIAVTFLYDNITIHREVIQLLLRHSSEVSVVLGSTIRICHGDCKSCVGKTMIAEGLNIHALNTQGRKILCPNLKKSIKTEAEDPRHQERYRTRQ